MKYRAGCIFNPKVPCPLSGLDLEISGAMCQACVDRAALSGLKASVITQLLLAYHKEEEAKKVFEQIKRCSREW